MRQPQAASHQTRTSPSRSAVLPYQIGQGVAAAEMKRRFKATDDDLGRLLDADLVHRNHGRYQPTDSGTWQLSGGPSPQKIRKGIGYVVRNASHRQSVHEFCTFSG